MNFSAFLIFFSCLLYNGTSYILNSDYNIIRSVLTYFRSRSAVLIYDGSGKKWEVEDMVVFLNIQKRLSFNNFYFSSLKTLSSLTEALGSRRYGVRETVAVLEFNDNFTHFLAQTTNETVMSSYKWLLTSTSNSQNLDELTVPLDCEFLIAHGSSQESYDIVETYNVDRNRKLIKPLGRWTNEDQLQLNSQDFFTRRRNLEGGVIKVITPMIDPCMEISFSMYTLRIAVCIQEIVWEIIAEMLNATTEMTVVKNLDEEVIKTADADVSLRSSLFTVNDLKTRSYVWPLFSVGVVVVTGHVRQQVEWRTFILPFSFEMWMVLLVWVILCDFIVTFFDLIARGREKRNFFSLYSSEFSFVAVSTVCSQGVSVPSKLLGIRLVFVMLFIVPVVLYPGYSAVLTSFLTVQLDRKPFQTLEELSQTNEYKIGWHKTFLLQNLFNMEDKSPLNQALLTNNLMSVEEVPETDAEGLDLICNGKFVYMTIIETVKAVKPKCSYYILRQPFKVMFSGIEMKKNSRLQYFVDRCERRLDFAGLLFRISKKTVLGLINYNEVFIATTELSPIKLENIILPFVVLLLGVFSSIILLIVELICFNLNSRGRRRRQPQHTFKTVKKTLI